MRRTTLSAEADDLAVLASEARRRGVSLAQVLREIVAHAADERRTARPKPHLGIARSRHPNPAQLSVDDEDSPAATPFRS